jgi:alkylated DNA repair dioxygenase AlkB
MDKIQYLNLDILSLEEFKLIWENKPTFRHEICMFGKMIKVPRIQVLYGTGSYKFSGSVLKAEDVEIPEYLQNCIEYVKKLEPDFVWNGALVNFYEDGDNYIGPHCDDERDLVDSSGIYSFSFGGERIFRIRNKIDKKIIKDFTTYDNSVIKMPDGFQQKYLHEIVKTKKSVNHRINVTIRSFVT